MRRLGRTKNAASVVTLLALLVSLAGWAGSASAAPLSYAGVVVRHGDGRMAYGYVGFTESEISGIELLKRTGLDVVTVGFGGLGEGVCSIDEHGCPATDCRKRVCQGPSDQDPFWQYFRQSEPGNWQWVALGASSTKVRNGDIDGWSWTAKEPNLPALTLEEIARRAGYDGTSFSGASAGEPGAALSREGDGPPRNDGQGAAIYAGAGALLAAAAGLVAFVTLRRRRVGGAAE